MSTTYFSWAFPAEPTDVSSDVGALEDVGDLLAQVPAAHLLMSASRNNWLLDNLRTLGSVRGLPHLRGLGSFSWVIAPAEIPDAIREIESLIGLAHEAPQSVAVALNPPCEATDISVALAASKEASVPHLGPTGAEDGDGPQYLFSWLKSLHVLLAHAHSSALCILHVQPGSQR